MKNLLLGSITLTIFSISIVLFQLSCTKDTIAQNTSYVLPPATNSSLGGIIVGNGLNITSNGTLSVTTTGTGGSQKNKLIIEKTIKSTGTTSPVEVWTANYDGSNQTKINIVLPAGYFNDGGTKISPDGNKLFLNLADAAGINYVYSCNIDGSNLTRIVTENANESFIGVVAAY